jgi:hypothetical protein
MNKPISKEFTTLKSLVSNGDFDSAHKLVKILAQMSLGPAAKSLLEAICLRYNLEMSNVNAAPPSEDNKRINVSYSDINTLAQLDEQPINEGISIVSCCMNRNDNLRKALITWLQLDVDEIVIVDWSSKDPVEETIKDLMDHRVKIIRVEGESKWVLTYGFNVGLRFARYSKIYKFDADITIKDSFINQNYFSESEYVRGNWKFAVESNNDEQKYVNGSFGAPKCALKDIGYYNEFIRTYGWDDSDIYNRLSLLQGMTPIFIAPSSLFHLEQDKEERLKHQAVNKHLFLDTFEPTEYYNIRNKYLTAINDSWCASKLADYSLVQKTPSVWEAKRISTELEIPKFVYIDAEKYAVLQLASWCNESLHYTLHCNPDLSQVVVDHFNRNIGITKTQEILALLSNEDFFESQLLPETGLIPAIESKTLQDILFVQNLNTALLLKHNGHESLLQPIVQRNEFSQISQQNDNRMPTVFVTSIFDEKKESRLLEYLYCVQENVKHFDYVVLLYEKKDGSFYNRVEEALKGSEYWSKLVLIEYNARPNFEFIFSLADCLFPHAIVHVSNADIAADATIRKIKPYADREKFFVISRCEVDPDSKASLGLILNQQGIANTFSADMWVYCSPRQYKFKCDFDIGSFHCDSFMNYHISESRYRLYNPCLDINLFHIHNPVFNSSETKAIELKKEIDARLEKEIALNNGIVPLAGSRWSTLEASSNTPISNGIVPWSNTLVKINITHNGANIIQAMATALLVAESLEYIHAQTSVWLTIDVANTTRDLVLLVEDFIRESGLTTVFFNVFDINETPIVNTIEANSLSEELILDTVNNIRASKNTEFFGFGCVTKNLSINFDPNVISEITPAVNDLISYHLLKALNVVQKDKLSDTISINDVSNRFLAFQKDFDCLKSSNKTFEWQIAQSHKEKPRVSFITSIFKGAEFMRGFLENIAVAALESGGEVILMDANSPQNEYEIFQDFIQQYPQLAHLFKYNKLDVDPGLYNCWQLGIEQSCSEYVSNANLDDRRSPYQAKILLDELNKKPAYSGAASAIRANTSRNTAWYCLTDNQYWFDKGYKEVIDFENLHLSDSNGHVKSQNIMHCMPVWKKSLHDEFGFFNENEYGTSADWAFWLECTLNGSKFILVPAVLSQYYINEQSHNRINDPNGIKENKIINDYFGKAQTAFVQQ